MKHIAFAFISLILSVALFSSCGTSNKVVSGGFIQKRKYKKGVHIGFIAKTNKRRNNQKQNLICQNDNLKKPFVQSSTNHNFLKGNEKTTNVKHYQSDDYVVVVKPDIKSVTKIESDVKSKGSIDSRIPYDTNYERNLVIDAIAVDEHEKPKMNLKALFGFLAFFFTIVFPLAPLIGLYFCIKALREIKEEPEKWKGKGFAIAGIVLNIIMIFAMIAFFGYLFLKLLVI